MSDDYQTFEQRVGDWQSTVKYRVIHDSSGITCNDVRWWVVENLETNSAFMWAYLDLGKTACEQPIGHYPRLLALYGGGIEFFMPRKQRTDEELDGIVDMVKGA